MQAHRHRLLDTMALQAVALDALHDLRHVLARFAHSAFDRDLAVAQINKGIAEANALLPDSLRLEPMPTPPSGKP